jgi:hypothetical protein
MGRVSRDARLAFVMMWTIADDEGRLRGNSRMLASLLFPYDDDAPGGMETWLEELSAEGCIHRYVVGSSSYIQIAKWLEHQKIDKPTKSRIPPPGEPSRTLANVREPSSLDLGSRTRTKEGDSEADASDAAAAASGGNPSSDPDPLPEPELPLEEPGQPATQGGGSEGKPTEVKPGDLLKARIFGECLSWLSQAMGRPADKLRPAVGRWCSTYGDGDVLVAMTSAARDSPVDPLSWIEKHLRSMSNGKPGKNKQKPSFADAQRANRAAIFAAIAPELEGMRPGAGGAEPRRAAGGLR